MAGSLLSNAGGAGELWAAGPLRLSQTVGPPSRPFSPEILLLFWLTVSDFLNLFLWNSKIRIKVRGMRKTDP